MSGKKVSFGRYKQVKALESLIRVYSFSAYRIVGFCRLYELATKATIRLLDMQDDLILQDSIYSDTY